MGMRRKGDLPTKLCAACGRPFAWRKRWEKVWDEVRYCSERCRRERRASAGSQMGFLMTDLKRHRLS